MPAEVEEHEMTSITEMCGREANNSVELFVSPDDASRADCQRVIKPVWTCSEPPVHRSTTFSPAADLSDESLVLSAQTGDHAAFAKLLGKHSTMVFRAIQRITRNHADAEDCLQDAILRAYLNIGTFQGQSTFSSWFTRIGINSALMFLRKRRARPETPVDYDCNEETVSLRVELRDRTMSPEEQLLRKERHARVKEAIGAMKPKYRSIVQMQVSGRSLRQIAASAGLTIPATKARLFRSKDMLRRRIQL